MHGGHGEREPLPESVNRVGTLALDACFTAHRRLGPGLLESVYENCVAYELSKLGLHVQQQFALPVIYDEMRLEVGYRIDLLVEGVVIIEVKSVEALAPVHTAQVLTYLRFSDRRLGYLVNFNTVMLKDGIRRLVR
jgi:GxxExxY protein